MALVVSTAPTIEPLTIEELKLAWGIDFGEHDELVERCGIAARIWVEDFLGRAIINTTYALHLVTWPSGSDLRLPRPPLSSVTSVKYYDTAGVQQTLGTGVYGTDTNSQPGRIYLKNGQTWPSLEDEPRKLRVTITYVAGHGATAAAALANRQHFAQAIVAVGREFYENPSWMLGKQTYTNEAARSLLWTDRFLGEVDGL